MIEILDNCPCRKKNKEWYVSCARWVVGAISKAIALKTSLCWLSTSMFIFRQETDAWNSHYSFSNVTKHNMIIYICRLFVFVMSFTRAIFMVAPYRFMISWQSLQKAFWLILVWSNTVLCFNPSETYLPSQLISRTSPEELKIAQSKHTCHLSMCLPFASAPTEHADVLSSSCLMNTSVSLGLQKVAKIITLK